MVASAAAVGRLAHPAGAAGHHHLLGREQLLEGGIAGLAVGSQPSADAISPAPRRSAAATCITARLPWLRANSSGTSTSAGPGAGSALLQQRPGCAARSRRSATASAAASSARHVLRDRPALTLRAPASCRASASTAAGVAQAAEHRLVVVGEQLGQHAVDHDRGHPHRHRGAEPVQQLERLDDRELLGRRHDDHARSGSGSARISVIQLRLVAHQAHLHEVVDRPRRRQLAGDVAGGRGVDDHQVVVALPDLVADLADGEDLLDARRGVGHEVERAGQRAEPGHAAARARRAAGTRAASPRCSWPSPTCRACTGRGLEAQRAGLERRGQRALGVDLADQHPLARGRGVDGRARPRSWSCRPRPCR